MTSNVLEVKENPETGELYLEFPEELLNQVGWSEGDVLEWFEQDDGTWRIEKRA